jgi:hypothetical protein
VKESNWQLAAGSWLVAVSRFAFCQLPAANGQKNDGTEFFIRDK